MSLEKAYDGDGFIFHGELKCQSCQCVYPVLEGIPRFIKPADLAKLDKKYAQLYNWIAPFYDSHSPIAKYVRRKFWPSGEQTARLEIIDRLEVGSRSRVLETGVGTGSNIPLLTKHEPEIEMYGLDSSSVMLNRCRRRATNWGQEVELFLADAASLPFQDSYFDVVFHVGGFNTFGKKKQAVEEMIRVAKNGTRIIIADETEKLINAATPLNKPGMN